MRIIDTIGKCLKLIMAIVAPIAASWIAFRATLMISDQVFNEELD